MVWLDTIDGGPGYRIRKFRYEALPGMWLPGLLYLPDKLAGSVPVAMHVNGHAPEGKAVNYKQLRSINLAKRGMPVVDLEWFGMGQLRTSGFAHGRMNQLDLCGASGLAPFYLALSRGLDIATSLEHVDKSRVVVSGLSGGGWQTILISSLDERVTLANPVAGYGGFRTNILFDDMGDSEQAPSDMAVVADYTHLTALQSAAAHAAHLQRQRRLLLQIGAHARPVGRSSATDLCAVRCRGSPALARQPCAGHAQLRAGESRAVVRRDRRLLFPGRCEIRAPRNRFANRN